MTTINRRIGDLERRLIPEKTFLVLISDLDGPGTFTQIHNDGTKTIYTAEEIEALPGPKIEVGVGIDLGRL